MVQRTNDTLIMVRVRTILTISIAILAVNYIRLAEAGEATKERIKNVESRASVHKEKLRSHGKVLQSQCSSMSATVNDQLEKINKIVLDYILNSTQFKLYLKNVFETLGIYAEKQIVSRVDKLEETYKQWEKINFPDKKKKEDAKQILENIKKENKEKDVEAVVKKRYLSKNKR